MKDLNPEDPCVLEPLPDYREYPVAEMHARAQWFHRDIARRRTVREFDSRPVPREVIEQCLLAAGTAPSGANQQPWHFAVITDPGCKRKIRVAAEAEEREFYARRAPQEWLDALAPLGTGPDKPFLEEAPVLIAIFAQKFGLRADGTRFSHYYFSESVGIASGFLIAALHHAGLATLTHTPNPMKFLNEICGRPAHERPTILLVVGYPKPGCRVPVHGGVKKPLAGISSWIERAESGTGTVAQ
jgi:nitroreductase